MIIYIVDGREEFKKIIFLEKKLGDAKEFPWQTRLRELIAEIMKFGIIELQKRGQKIIWGGYHVVNVPNGKLDKMSYKNWASIKLNGKFMSYHDLARILNSKEKFAV